MNYLPALRKSLKWEIVAHGEEKPVATNRNANGRAKNRRVEIILWER